MYTLYPVASAIGVHGGFYLSLAFLGLCILALIGNECYKASLITIGILIFVAYISFNDIGYSDPRNEKVSAKFIAFRPDVVVTTGTKGRIDYNHKTYCEFELENKSKVALVCDPNQAISEYVYLYRN